MLRVFILVRKNWVAKWHFSKKAYWMCRFFRTYSPRWNNKSTLVFPRQVRSWRKNLPIQYAQGHQPVRLVVVFWWRVVFSWWWCDVWCNRMWCDVLSCDAIWCDVMWSHVKWCTGKMLCGWFWGHAMWRMWFYGDTETYNGESLEMTSTICGETLEDTLVVRAQ